MNAKQARKLSDKFHKRSVAIDERIIAAIAAQATVGGTTAHFISGNLELLIDSKEALEKNGYNVSLIEKSDTQGDDRSWGYVHTLVINW
jgi:hypothetical protein